MKFLWIEISLAETIKTIFMLQIDFVLWFIFILYPPTRFLISPNRVHFGVLQNESHLAFSIFVSLWLFWLKSVVRWLAEVYLANWLDSHLSSIWVLCSAPTFVTFAFQMTVNYPLPTLCPLSLSRCLFAFFLPPWGQGKRNWFSARVDFFYMCIFKVLVFYYIVCLMQSIYTIHIYIKKINFIWLNY